MAWAEFARHVDGARERFANAARQPRRAQETLLQSILARHAACAFGRTFGFAEMAKHVNLSEFQRRLPLADPDDVAAEMQAVAGGAVPRLVDESLSAFERTGGSSGGAKLIALTPSGLSALQSGLHAWLDDLCTARPAVIAGSSYWSISPVARELSHTASGVRIGLASDAEYFGPAAQHLLAVMAVPPMAAQVPELDNWRLLTLQCLLADASLSLVSIWSPTFWLELCRHAVLQQEPLTRAIAQGCWAAELSTSLQAQLPHPRADPARARLLAAVLSSSAPDWTLVWPGLSMISCWSHASAAPWAAQLAAAFPAVEIQGKGLLATEGLISVPLCDGGDPVASITASVLEFEDDDGVLHTCDQLHLGGEYNVVMTTSAGLYRYRLGDRVQVTGWWHAAPRLRFLGRGAATADLCGEKLSEAFVLRCCAKVGIPPGASLRLVPLMSVGLSRPRYELLLERGEHSDDSIHTLGQRLDATLRLNPQYAYARDLGQLDALSTRCIDQLAARMQALALARGQRLGDAKPAILGRPDDIDLGLLDELLRPRQTLQTPVS